MTSAPLREHLVDVGVTLVSTHGADTLGLREIARMAGVSHGAPRRYFPTHRSLLSAIARRGFDDLAARFAAAGTRTPGPRDRLAALAKVYLDFATDNRDMFGLMFRHDLLAGDPADPGPRLRDATRPLFDGLVALVDRHLTDSGRTGDPVAVTAALWTNLHGVAELWTAESLPLMLRTEPSDTAGLESLIDTVLDAHLGRR